VKYMRSCFTCEHHRLCYLRRKINEALMGANINIDGDIAPAKYLDIFETLGRMCLDYKFKKEE